MAGGDTKQRINELESEIMRLKEAQPTLRDQFAMAALTGILSNSSVQRQPSWELAFDSFLLADAMMDARNAQR